MVIVTLTSPTVDTALAGTKTVALVEVGKEAADACVPLTWTVTDCAKLVPVSVRAKLGAPAVTLTGEMLLSTGTGLTTAKVSTFELMFCDALSRVDMDRVPVEERYWTGIVN